MEYNKLRMKMGSLKQSVPIHDNWTNSSRWLQNNIFLHMTLKR